MKNATKRTWIALGLAATAAFVVTPAHANDNFTYEVTVTNITFGQQFTPLLLFTHRASLQLFDLGKPASANLATLAEEGNVAPLRAELEADSRVFATEAGAGLTNPGATATFTIRGHPLRHRVSVAAMLIPTNDAFVALNGVALPWHGSVTFFARAYDAGSEANDELCASIPGPFFAECGGPGGGARIGDGEGFVHIHRGIHSIGNLAPSNRDWRNPVAEITVRRVH